VEISKRAYRINLNNGFLDKKLLRTWRMNSQCLYSTTRWVVSA
jgi:hypothetical protein